VNEMSVLEQKIKREVEAALREFPDDKMAELLDFVLFLRKRYAEERGQRTTDVGRASLHPRTIAASHLDQLTGIVEWGGDALDDSERLYDANL
jgi:hypothetical protein